MSVDDLLRQAADCASSGDAEGELAAYLRADELGDAEGAVLLGNALRARGQDGLAREAYERAEARGHREAAMSLGNLLSDLGDKPGAQAAYLRSIALGSTLASLNLGLMLAEAGDTDGALFHLQRAASGGDPGGFWGIGKINERQRNWAAAASAYRDGAQLGDPHCAYGLGVALFELGDRDGARAAFQHAHELGHSGALDLVEALDREGSDPVSPEPTVGRLWSDVTGLYGSLAEQRSQLGRHWITQTLTVQERQAELNALQRARQEVQDQLTAISKQFNVRPDGHRGDIHPPAPGPTPAAWLGQHSGSGGVPVLADAQKRAFDADLEAARHALRQAASKKLGMLQRQKGTEAAGRVAARLSGLDDALVAAKRSVREAEEARDTAARFSMQRALEALTPVASLAARSALDLPAVLQPWTSPAWEPANFDSEASLGLRLAYGGVLTPKADERLGPNARFGTDIRIPWGFALHDSWFVQHAGPSRGAAQGFVRSMMLRQLLSVKPGEVKFCIFDPVGLGQSAGDMLDLAEYNADLIGGKIWSASQDLEARLAELSSHIELVIQKYLRTTYKTIDEFNDDAGEVAEPYRTLVLFDFPAGLSAESAMRLKSIVENGPRCGVFTWISAELSDQPPYGVNVDQVVSSMRRLNLQGGFADNVDGYQLETTFEHDVLPERSDAAKRIIDEVGRASIARAESAVTFAKVFTMYSGVLKRGLRPELGTAATGIDLADPGTWWTGDSTRGLFAPIGQKGARDAAILGFDSSDHFGALLVGRPGSGKSTLLHTLIAGLTTLYGPDQLELYLIDFKEGVEFKAYAEERLPHAKVIAIESDREFGLSVLESLQAEISQRAELLRATGGRQAGLQSLREATGETIPRILLVFDEFQVLFSRNDKVGVVAADLMEAIIRQGRGFGIHVLLGSQSLAGLDALGSHVPQLLPVRILLPASDSDARKVLGDNNDAGDFLSGHGEGILNSAGGAVEANERFKGALLTESERAKRLEMMRSKADGAGFTRTPMVFEGNALVPLDMQDPGRFREELAATGASPIRLRGGVPMTVGDIGDLVLYREGGANVLVIGRGGEAADSGVELANGPMYGFLAAAVASAAMSAASVDVIDFMSNDDGLDSLLEPLLDSGRITLRRRRAFPDLLSQIADEVADRVDQDDSRRPAKLLFLFGIHRARDLDSEFGALDVDGDLVEKLERLMRDGPEVGVHVCLWSESVAGAARRLTPRMMREIGWRVAGRMGSDDSNTFIASGEAANLRESQLLMVNEDRGFSTRVTAFSPPSRGWLLQIAAGTRND